MKKVREHKTGLALSGLTAAVALLVGMSQAQAQAPVPAPPLSGAGSFPGSFIVPGTNTSVRIGGFVQLDVHYDMSAFGNASSPGAIDNFNPNSVELTGNGIAGNPAGHTDHGALRATAQNTRPSIETRTPTEYGELKTYVEFDFAGNQSNSTAGAGTVGATQTNFNQASVARIRQAYGTLGPWLFGITNSNFADLAAWADTLDAPVEAGGMMGVGSVRVAQIRYTWLLPNGVSASGSLESFPSAGLIATAGTGAGPVTWNNFNSPGFGENLPAVTGTARVDQPWGHAAFHFAVAQEHLKNLFTPGTGFTTAELPTGGHISQWGYMLSQTGHLNTIGKDKITWQLSYGQGAANYTWALNELGTQWEEGLICSVNGAANSYTCSQPRIMGVNAGYSHYWNDNWRSTISGGYDQVSRPNAAADWSPTTAGGGLTDLERKHYSAAVNLLWTPVRGTQFGVEYEWYHRTVWSGAHGSGNRIETQALFAF